MTPESLAIPDLGAQSPALRETRELIDDVDREIVALLARRAWAVEHGLEPTSVEEIFEAVLRFSRGVQQSRARRKEAGPSDPEP